MQSVVQGPVQRCRQQTRDEQQKNGPLRAAGKIGSKVHGVTLARPARICQVEAWQAPRTVKPLAEQAAPPKTDLSRAGLPSV